MEVAPDQVLQIAERFKKLYTGLVYDYLDGLGLPNQALASELKPLTPNMKLAGPAFTVRGHSTVSRDPEIHKIRLLMLREMTMGCIQVRDVGKDVRCGHFGEISATAAYAAGCRGAVIDGGTRDTNYLINMGFPTFARFINPVEALGRWMIFEYNIPIILRGVLGDVVVNPGDWMFGDNDGVIVIPKDLVMETIDECEKICDKESVSRKAMAAGEDPYEVFQKYGRF